MVIVIENAPPALYGRLSLWLLEIRRGVFIGDYSVKVRTMIWETVTTGINAGNAIMAWHEPNEAGYDFITLGRQRRIPCNLDGAKLISFYPENDNYRNEVSDDAPSPYRNYPNRKKKRSASKLMQYGGE